MKIETKFSIRQKVFIAELRCTATVISLCVDGEGVQYQCRWFNNGEQKTGYLIEEELQPCPHSGPPGFVRIETNPGPISLSAPELS